MKPTVLVTSPAVAVRDVVDDDGSTMRSKDRDREKKREREREK